MKKILLSLVLFCTVANCTAQFDLTSDGFRSSKDKKLDYIVIQFPDMDSEDILGHLSLYLRSRSSYTDNINISPDLQTVVLGGTDRTSVWFTETVEMEKGKDKERETVKRKKYYHTDYIIVFRIKDGKLRIDSPVINKITHRDGSEIVLKSRGFMYNETPIFTKKGKVALGMKETKYQLEKFFNDLVYGVTTVMPVDDNW